VADAKISEAAARDSEAQEDARVYMVALTARQSSFPDIMIEIYGGVHARNVNACVSLENCTPMSPKPYASL